VGRPHGSLFTLLPFDRLIVRLFFRDVRGGVGETSVIDCLSAPLQVGLTGMKRFIPASPLLVSSAIFPPVSGSNTNDIHVIDRCLGFVV
jgi:hypothetical protein